MRRLPITELGCAGGAAALARAHDFLVGFPAARALVIAVELPSLSMQRADLSPANLVSTALFGDGAAAAVLAGGETGVGGRAVSLLETLSHIWPRSAYALGFDLKDDGFHSVLSKDVPALLKSEIARAGRHAGGAARASRGSSCRLSCCTRAGRKILGFVEEELGLPRDDTQPSWDVLRDYGNQSSASVLFVLHEWLTRRRPPRRDARRAGGVRARPHQRDAAARVELTMTASRRSSFSCWSVAVGACRLVELRLSRRHQRALAAGGAPLLPEPVFPRDGGAAHRRSSPPRRSRCCCCGRPFVAALAIPALALVVLANAAALLGDRHAGRALERARRAARCRSAW